MNEAMKNLLTRRSVRSYADRPVPEDALRAILQAGAYAPTDVVQKTRKLESNNKRPDYMASFSYQSFGPALTYSLMA